jgi:hypothetical protein
MEFGREWAGRVGKKFLGRKFWRTAVYGGVLALAVFLG